MAITTFVGQNLGAKQYDRAKKGAKFGILCSISIAELIGITIYTAAPVLIAAFNRDPDVIHYGVMQARTIALFYCLLAFTHCIAAVLRGSGNAAVPMIVLLCVWCLFRVSYITLAVRLIPDIRVIFWAYPLTWSISSVIFLFLFLRGNWVHGFEKKVTGFRTGKRKNGKLLQGLSGMQRKSLQESDAGSGSQRNRRYGDSEL